jgi:N4-gp56 family major capsid protein
MALKNWTEVSTSVFGNEQLSKKLRMIAEKKMKLASLVAPAADLYLGKKAGASVGLRLQGRISGVGTTPIGETDPVPFSKPPFYYVTATVKRYARAVAWTGEFQDLDRMDAKDPTVKALNEHHARTTNALIYNELVAGRSFCYVPTGATAGNFTTNGTPTGTANAPLTLWHLQNISKHLSKNNMPPADGDNYLVALSPTAKFNILQDTASGGFIDVKKYANGGAEGILKNEIGKVSNMRLFEDNDALPDGIGSSSLYGSAFIVGFDGIREVPVYPMHLRFNGNLGGDFGNQAGIAWQMLCTWKSIWNFTSHGQGGICQLTTA